MDRPGSRTCCDWFGATLSIGRQPMARQKLQVCAVVQSVHDWRDSEVRADSRHLSRHSAHLPLPSVPPGRIRPSLSSIAVRTPVDSSRAIDDSGHLHELQIIWRIGRGPFRLFLHGCGLNRRTAKKTESQCCHRNPVRPLRRKVNPRNGLQHENNRRHRVCISAARL